MRTSTSACSISGLISNLDTDFQDLCIHHRLISRQGFEYIAQ